MTYLLIFHIALKERLAGNVARIEDIRKAYRTLVGTCRKETARKCQA